MLGTKCYFLDLPSPTTFAFEIESPRAYSLIKLGAKTKLRASSFDVGNAGNVGNEVRFHRYAEPPLFSVDHEFDRSYDRPRLRIVIVI
jgi:hypothetical protein